jgi:GT2 family glycosyltransferase
MVMQQLSIIIVNWNTGSLLQQCLESIASLPEQDLIHHVVVIDNASKDTSVEQAKEFAKEHGYAIFKEKYNLGFAKANNLAWKYIEKHDGKDDHILLLNPDTEVHPGALSSMVDTLERTPTTGIVGPKLLEASGEVQPSVRSFPTLGVFILLFLKLHRLFPTPRFWNHYMMKDFDYTKKQTVDQVMGAAFLIRNVVAQSLGLLDESFWIWFEEVDLCKRAKDKGWDTIYTPNATVLHYGGTSFNQLIGLARTKPFLKSSLVYAKKHLGLLPYGILLFLYPFALVIAAMASLAHLQQKKPHNVPA